MPNPYYNRRYAPQKHRDWIDRIATGLSGATLVVAVCAAVAAGFAARFTYGQWRTAADMEERQLRAYVGVVLTKSVSTNPFVPPTVPEIHFDIRNSGATPAFEVTHESWGSICDHPLATQFDFSPTRLTTIAEPITIFPGTVDNLGIQIRLKRSLTDEEFTSIVTGDSKRLCFWGTVSYRDTFRRKWFTNFCYGYFANAAKTTYEPCERHNDAS